LAFIDLIYQKSSPSDIRQRDSSNAEKASKLHVSGTKEVHLKLSREWGKFLPETCNELPALSRNTLNPSAKSEGVEGEC
jgi:hypothetical protein